MSYCVLDLFCNVCYCYWKRGGAEESSIARVRCAWESSWTLKCCYIYIRFNRTLDRPLMNNITETIESYKKREIRMIVS